MSVLVTGGAGFIGSHTVVELLNKGYDVVIVDNFVNSKKDSLDAIKKITGKDFKFYEVDVTDREKLSKVFDENPDIDSVIHFAALKAVGESVEKPIEYYENNLQSTLVLVDVTWPLSIYREPPAEFTIPGFCLLLITLPASRVPPPVVSLIVNDAPF